MAEHARCDLCYWQTIAPQHHREQVEAGMTTTIEEYWQAWDRAAQDRSSPWLPPAPVADKETSEARGVVEDTLTARGKNYGDFTDNAKISQDLKEIVRKYIRSNPVAIEPYMEEAIDMIFSKIGRLLSGNPYYEDGWHDIQGYAKLVEQHINKRSKR